MPFIEAVEKMSQFLQERKIDMFKDGISVPGLTLKYLFLFLGYLVYYSLFDQANSDLYYLIKDTNTGGPCIIFHRYHEAGKTMIREAEKGQAAKLCEKITTEKNLTQDEINPWRIVGTTQRQYRIHPQQRLPCCGDVWM